VDRQRPPRQLRRLITELHQAAAEAVELMLPADESHWEHPIRKRPEAKSQAWVALVDRDARRLLGQARRVCRALISRPPSSTSPANAYNVGAISSHTATDPRSRVRLHDPAGLGGQRVAPRAPRR
jgi:hypothetical protein